MALKRGAGPKGLAAMPLIKPFGMGHLLRPLLSISKVDIHHYAVEQQLKWIEDESNQNTNFDRNFLRLNGLSTLLERWPSFMDTTTRSIALISEEHTLLETLLLDKLPEMLDLEQPLTAYLASHSNTKFRYALDCLKLRIDNSALVMQLLRLWLAKNGVHPLPTQAQLTHIYHDLICAKPDRDPCFEGSDYQLRVSYNRLYLLPKFKNLLAWQTLLRLEEPLLLPDQLGAVLLTQSPNNGKINTALLVRAPHETEAVSVRFNGIGLHCQPTGRRDNHRLKKIYQELKIPSWERTRLPLLFYNEQLIAVGNLFSCIDTDRTEPKEVSVAYWSWHLNSVQP